MRYPLFAALLVGACSLGTSTFTGSAQAQLAKGGTPASALGPERGDVPYAVLPHPDVAALREEDETSEGALRYGAVIPTAFTLDRDGRWDQFATDASDHALAWRLEIVSPGAESLGVIFDEYELPETGRVFVYSPDRSYVLGAFDASTRQPNGMLATSPVPGDRVVVEYVQDFAEEGTPRLRIGRVIHDYLGVFGVTARVAAPKPPACVIDVNCPQGDDYQDEKRAVVGFTSGEGFACSGVMLNNTQENGAPYLMTALNCGNLTNVNVVFDYENPTCGGTGAMMTKSVSGATLLAADAQIGAQLYTLSSTPPESYEPYFAGWTRTFHPRGPTVSINHPSGAPKKIAVDFDDPYRTGHDWSAVWDDGACDQGSIGGPLFEKRGRVIGVANKNITISVCSVQTTAFSRFNQFWNAAGLKAWLDPTGRNPTGLVGFDPYVPTSVRYNGAQTNPRVFSSTLPTINRSWIGTVDTSKHPGATSSIIVFHSAFSMGTFVKAGEILVNLASPRFLTTSAPAVNGTSTHSLFIPNSQTARGIVTYAQAVILGGGSAELTNALKLRIN